MVRPRFGVERSRTLLIWRGSKLNPPAFMRCFNLALLADLFHQFTSFNLSFSKSLYLYRPPLAFLLDIQVFYSRSIVVTRVNDPRVALRASNFVFQRNTRSIGVHVYLCFHYFDEFPFFFFFFFFSPPPSPNRIRIGNEYRAPILLHSLHWIPDSLLYICSGNARSELINHIDAIFRVTNVSFFFFVLLTKLHS